MQIDANSSKTDENKHTSRERSQTFQIHGGGGGGQTALYLPKSLELVFGHTCRGVEAICQVSFLKLYKFPVWVR